MARIRHHGRNADDAAPADQGGDEPAATPGDAVAAAGLGPVLAQPAGFAADTAFGSLRDWDAEVKRQIAGGLPRWLVNIPGCHPEDLVIEAATEADAVEAYKARLGITLLPVPAVVTPAPDAAPAPE